MAPVVDSGSWKLEGGRAGISTRGAIYHRASLVRARARELATIAYMGESVSYG